MIHSEPKVRSLLRSAFAAGIAAAALFPVTAPAQTPMSEKAVEAAQTKFPFSIPKKGPVALHLQILLDRAGFSPGIIDGAWGINAAKAITFFTKPDDLERLTGDAPASVASVDR